MSFASEKFTLNPFVICKLFLDSQYPISISKSGLYEISLQKVPYCKGLFDFYVIRVDIKFFRLSIYRVYYLTNIYLPVYFLLSPLQNELFVFLNSEICRTASPKGELVLLHHLFLSMTGEKNRWYFVTEIISLNFFL